MLQELNKQQMSATRALSRFCTPVLYFLLVAKLWAVIKMYTNWKLAFEKGTPEGPNMVCYQVGRGSVHIRGNVSGDGSPFERQV